MTSFPGCLRHSLQPEAVHPIQPPLQQFHSVFDHCFPKPVPLQQVIEVCLVIHQPVQPGVDNRLLQEGELEVHRFQLFFDFVFDPASNNINVVSISCEVYTWVSLFQT